MKNKDIKNIVECLLFVSSKTLSAGKLAQVIDGTTEDEILEIINRISKEYEEADKPIFVQNVAGGWRFATRNEYAKWVKILFSKETTYKLTNAAMETLAIIAYRQPVTTQEIEAIRGVSSGGVLRGLLEKRLIKLAGRKEVIGRPILYKRTDTFLEYLGLESISDLPPLEELGIEEYVEDLIDEKNKRSD